MVLVVEIVAHHTPLPLRLELNVAARGATVSRIVLVTGGGNGIGKTVAARFRSGGDAVIITGRNIDRLTNAATEIGGRAIPCDGTDARQVARMADELGAALDVVVNMAGGNTDF